MTPELALGELVAASGHGPDRGPERAPRDGAPPPPSPFANSINHTYFVLRRWVAIVAILLPITLWLGTAPVPQPSMSEYYHNPGGWMRDVFVGALWAVGFVLHFYKGYTRAESIALTIAGFCAVMVAMAPMAWVPTHWDCANPRLIPASWGLHAVFAGTLFVMIAYVCIFRSGDTLQLLDDRKARAAFQRVYYVLGTLMVAVPLSELAIWYSGGMQKGSLIIFAIEAAGIWVFGTFWLVKSREIARIQAQGAG
ncbi:MAG: putative rane protein [Sphingomonas bacterium]|nr:putative rane protein [Sphingomonas bacterium]